MTLQLDKNTFSRSDVDYMIAIFDKAVERDLLVPRSENNPYLIASYEGVGQAGVPSEWNIKIYSNSKAVHKLVCTDRDVLRALLNGSYESPEKGIPRRD